MISRKFVPTANVINCPQVMMSVVTHVLNTKKHSSCFSNQSIMEMQQIKIIQINRLKVEMTTLRNKVSTDKYNVVLMQEPYIYPGKTKGLGLRGTLVEKASIFIANSSLRCIVLSQYLSETVVAVKLYIRNEEIVLVSQYCNIHMDPTGDAELLMEIFRKYPKVIFGSDTNAHSTTWYCDETNDRGQVFEDYTQTGIELLNERYPYTAFTSHAGFSTNIDITL